jgi:hypothetical protein
MNVRQVKRLGGGRWTGVGRGRLRRHGRGFGARDWLDRGGARRARSVSRTGEEKEFVSLNDGRRSGRGPGFWRVEWVWTGVGRLPLGTIGGDGRLIGRLETCNLAGDQNGRVQDTAGEENGEVVRSVPTMGGWRRQNILVTYKCVKVEMKTDHYFTVCPIL